MQFLSKHKFMEDVDIFMPNNYDVHQEVVLGSYGTLEWVDAKFRRDRYLRGLKTIQRNTNWLTPPGFQLGEWVVNSEEFDAFTFFDVEHVLISKTDVLINVVASKNKLDVSITGSLEWVSWAEQLFSAQFKKAEHLIRWVYNGRGDDISVPLNYRPALESAYPWIGKPLGEYINDYLSSEASVLILIGPPGTGKTTFVKNIIQQSGASARVTYDEKVLNSDDFFVAFIDGRDDILVMEDADAFLASRQDGNTMMHKFLNVSDGLISTIGKKLIFSTNLPNINDIDSALTRTGRCFDILQFRPLLRDEAQRVLEEAGVNRPLDDGSEFTLAQIFTSQPYASSENKLNRKFGFV